MAVRVGVINLSIGGPDHTDAPFADKVAEAVAAGATFVSAIGNDGPMGGTLNSPGDMPAVLGVGGLAAGGAAVAAFSSRGPTLWAGEGGSGGAGRAKPDVVAHASSLGGSTLDGGCRAMSGTSVAAPVVAGAVALVVSGLREAAATAAAARQRQSGSGGSAEAEAAAAAAAAAAVAAADAAAEYLGNPAAVRQSLLATARLLRAPPPAAEEEGEGEEERGGGGSKDAFRRRLAAARAWRGWGAADQGAGHIDVVAAADWIREGLLRRLIATAAGGSSGNGSSSSDHHCLAPGEGLPVEGAVTAFPAAVAFDAAACPHAWPQCSQPLWPGGRGAGAVPGIANLTLLNSLGVVSTVVAWAWRPGAAGGERLRVTATPQAPVAPWAGWVGVHVEALAAEAAPAAAAAAAPAAAAAAAEGAVSEGEPAAAAAPPLAWDDPAACDLASGILELTVATPLDPGRRRWLRALSGGPHATATGPPPPLQGCDNTWAPGSSASSSGGGVVLSTLRIRVSASVARVPPPRARRVLWSMRHSLAYPHAYVPRDELYSGGGGVGGGGGGDVLDWHGGAEGGMKGGPTHS